MMKWTLILLALLEICLLYKSVTGLKATVCEGGHLPLACPPDTFISVTSAMYGRLDQTTCPYANISQTNCSTTTGTLAALQALCNGEKYCNVDAQSYYFGEPCKGIFKYLTFEYSCLPCVNTYGDDAMCDMWYLYGECRGVNSDWMGKYCSKSCFKCESVVNSTCANVANDNNCTMMANKGDCYSNPAYMGAYCKKACAQCDQPTTCADKANATECKARSGAGECAKNSGYMLPTCGKTCFNCTDTIRCENKNAACDEWAMKGKCQSDPGTMMSMCTKSCLGCSADPVCANTDSQCDRYASNGECTRNSVWMYRNCWKSCINCSSPHVCSNVVDSALCEVWAGNGECAVNPQYMLANCRLSCTRCKALDYGKPRCINALFNDSLCLTYAQWGECTNNPGYMLRQCYRTCTSCYSPYGIGNSATPGNSLDFTASMSMVLPYEFTETAVLRQFAVFFTAITPMYVQIWGPNGTNTFNLKYSQLVFPQAANQAQDIKVLGCVVVNATDRIGMTTISGPNPVAATMDKDLYSNYIGLRDSAAVGQEFFTINVPVKFSLSAEFTVSSAC